MSPYREPSTRIEVRPGDMVIHCDPDKWPMRITKRASGEPRVVWEVNGDCFCCWDYWPDADVSAWPGNGATAPNNKTEKT